MATGTMRRATLAITIGLACASYALPQEAAPAKEGQAEQGDSMIWWKWANFAILAAGLAYLIGKNVPPLFRKQSDEIQRALAEHLGGKGAGGLLHQKGSEQGGGIDYDRQEWQRQGAGQRAGDDQGGDRRCAEDGAGVDFFGERH